MDIEKMPLSLLLHEGCFRAGQEGHPTAYMVRDLRTKTLGIVLGCLSEAEFEAIGAEFKRLMGNSGVAHLMVHHG